jgi:hypothetical protein
MSRTKREPFDWIEWLDGFADRIKRDGVKRQPPLHKRTTSNTGWASDGIWTKEGKRKFKRRRNKDDRLERKKDLEEIVKDGEES